MASGLVPKQDWREQQGPKSEMALPPPSGPNEQSSCPCRLGKARSLGGHRGREQNLTPRGENRSGTEREKTGGGFGRRKDAKQGAFPSSFHSQGGY